MKLVAATAALLLGVLSATPALAEEFDFDLVPAGSELYLLEKHSGCVWRKGTNGDWLFEGPNAATRRAPCDMIIEKAPRVANQNG